MSKEEEKNNLEKIYPSFDFDLTKFDEVNIYDKDYDDCYNITIYATKRNSIQICFTFHIPHDKFKIDI